VLYAGRLTREKSVDLLADAFLAAQRRRPELHMVLAGGGPEAGALQERLGDCATFLGWLEGEELARVYASSDGFLFASDTDTFGQVVLEAQASGLPVVAVSGGGAASLIEPGETGLLAAPEPEPLAQALLTVAGSPLLAERLRRGGLAAIQSRTWAASMQQLAVGYETALGAGEARRVLSVA
jgi:glycosyltransferase involved in cell wall biosynthesis